MKGGGQRFREQVLRVVFLLSVIGLLVPMVPVNGAGADEYDPQHAGNPLRLTAYLLHPVGVLIDYGLMRPCFFVVQREPFSTIFGYVPPHSRDHSEEEQP